MQISVVKVFDMMPFSHIAIFPFGDETENVGIPFEVTSEGMQDYDKNRSEIFGFIHL